MSQFLVLVFVLMLAALFMFVFMALFLVFMFLVMMFTCSDGHVQALLGAIEDEHIRMAVTQGLKMGVLVLMVVMIVMFISSYG